MKRSVRVSPNGRRSSQLRSAALTQSKFSRRRSNGLRSRSNQNRESRAASVVIAVNELVHIKLKILRTDTVISSIDGTFELSPETLDGIGMDTASSVFKLGVVDELMRETALHP